MPRSGAPPAIDRIAGRRRHVFFDLDGTLIDSGEGISRSIQYALGRLGLPPPEQTEVLGLVGRPLRESVRELMGTHDEDRVATALRFYRERYATVGAFESRLYPGIVGILQLLRALGLILYVVTSKPSVYAGQIVEHLQIARHFRRVHGSELDGTRTHKADLIHHVLSVERLRAREAIMIGDRRYDIEGARVNGVDAIAVAWGYGAADELKDLAPVRLVQVPAELPDAILRA